MQQNRRTCQKMRVRTGCLTCRKRRVKCDEAKPLCRRCINANVVCDGYRERRNVGSPPKSDSSPSQRAETVLLPRNEHRVSPVVGDWSPSASHNPATLESLPLLQSIRADSRCGLPYYHHFVTSTAPRLFGGEFIEFWRDQVASMAWQDDLVFKAVLSVGALHQAHLRSSASTALSDARSCQVFGMRSYGEVLRLLSERVHQGDDQQIQSLLVIVILLTYFEVDHPVACCRPNIGLTIYST